jgi:hypothetical protein
VAETIEASLQLSEAVLVDVGVPMGPVIASIHERRDAIQASIKAMAPAAEVRTLGVGACAMNGDPSLRPSNAEPLRRNDGVARAKNKREVVLRCVLPA